LVISSCADSPDRVGARVRACRYDYLIIDDLLIV